MSSAVGEKVPLLDQYAAKPEISPATKRYVSQSAFWLTTRRINISVLSAMALTIEGFAIAFFSNRFAKTDEQAGLERMGLIFTDLVFGVFAVITLIGAAVLLKKNPYSPQDAALICNAIKEIKTLPAFIERFPMGFYNTPFHELFNCGIIDHIHRPELEGLYAEYKVLEKTALPYANLPRSLQVDSRISTAQIQAAGKLADNKAALEARFQIWLTKIKADLPDPLGLICDQSARV